MSSRKMSLREMRARNRLMVVLGLTAMLVVGNAVIWLSCSSAAEERRPDETAVFLYDTVAIGDGQVAYLGEDTRGRQYMVESGDFRFAFSNQNVANVRVATRDGRWYIQEVIKSR